MIRYSLLAVVLSLFWGCATPVAPSGGPPDTTPPDLIGMYPPSNSVDFVGGPIRFDFSERIDRASFLQALSIVPELPNPPALKWKGNSVEMTFPDSLSEATTYVFTFDNSLRDERRVALREPIVRAIATGSEIDAGVISGRFLDAKSGKPSVGFDVFAIRTDTIGQTAAAPVRYRTQTGPDGLFHFRFLPEAPFFVFGFEDLNRSRSLEAGEQFAVPARETYVPAVSDSLLPVSDWFVVDPDTVAPVALSARALSSRRVEIRYSEAIRMDSLAPDRWSVADTLSSFAASATGVYLNPLDRRRLVLLTDSLPPSTYRIGGTAAVRDSAGNRSTTKPPAFEVKAVRDTLRTRVLGFLPEAVVGSRTTHITARQRPGIRLNQFVAHDVLASMIRVSDTTGTSRTFSLESRDGAAWRLDVQPAMQAGEVLRVKVDSALVGMDSTLSMDFTLLSAEQTGSLAGVIDTDGPAVIEIYAEKARSLQLESTIRVEGAYLAQGLPVGNYKLRIFSDLDADGQWDWGQVDPYEKPDALMWYPDSARVRAGWETVLDTLRLSGR